MNPIEAKLKQLSELSEKYKAAYVNFDDQIRRVEKEISKMTIYKEHAFVDVEQFGHLSIEKTAEKYCFYRIYYTGLHKSSVKTKLRTCEPRIRAEAIKHLPKLLDVIYKNQSRPENIYMLYA